MSLTCWINGKQGAQVSALDRGLNYGDGLFETMAVRQGRIILLNLHLRRLMEGCGRLQLPLPDMALLRGELDLAAAGQDNVLLKLIVTRGAGGRGYRPPADAQATRILTRHAMPVYPQQWEKDGIRMRLCSVRLGHNTLLAGIKHLNRLEQVLARNEWTDADDFQEGLMTDADGRVIEGTMTNVFLEMANGSLMTPNLQLCGVAGIMRQYLLDRASQAGIHVTIAELTLDDVMAASGLFICNSVIGVWPVRQFDNRHYEMGELTRRAQQWARQA